MNSYGKYTFRESGDKFNATLSVKYEAQHINCKKAESNLALS